MPSVDISDRDRRDMVDIVKLYIHIIEAMNCFSKVSQRVINFGDCYL